MKRKTTSAVLALFMTLALLAGCTTATPGVQASGSPPATGEATVQPTAAPLTDADKLAGYDPPITLTIAGVQKDPNEEPIAGGQTSDNNVWLDEYKAMGIDLEPMFVVSSDKLADKLNLQIASGQVPDFMALNREQFEMMVKANLAEDMTDVFNAYSTDQTKQTMNSDGGICMKMSTINDRLYALPGTQGFLDGASIVTWIRKDWLDKLKLDVPKSFDDLYNVMKAFAQNDPDGDNLDDTIGYATTNSLNEAMGTFMSFHAYPTAWIKNDQGETVFGGVQPQVKDALQYLNKLYNEKILNPEFGAVGWDQYLTSVTSGKVGVVLGQWWFVDWPLGQTHTELGADWIPVQIFPADSQPAKVLAPAGPSAYYVVRKGYEHPEALVKILNVWFSKIYGTKEDMLKYAKNEKGEMPSLFAIMQPWMAHEDLHYYRIIRDALQTGKAPENMDPSCQMYYDSVVQYMQSPSEDTYKNYKMYGPDSGSKVLDNYDVNGLVIFDQFYGASTDTMKDKWGYLETKRLETYVKIIMGELSPDAFDTFTQDWMSSGGEQITNEVRDWVKANSN